MKKPKALIVNCTPPDGDLLDLNAIAFEEIAPEPLIAYFNCPRSDGATENWAELLNLCGVFSIKILYLPRRYPPEVYWIGATLVARTSKPPDIQFCPPRNGRPPQFPSHLLREGHSHIYCPRQLEREAKRLVLAVSRGSFDEEKTEFLDKIASLPDSPSPPKSRSRLFPKNLKADFLITVPKAIANELKEILVAIAWGDEAETETLLTKIKEKSNA